MLERMSYEHMFQFQTGSIRSLAAKENLPFKHRFNSKLVRLEGCWRIKKTVILSSFNSKLVRLEVKYLPDALDKIFK